MSKEACLWLAERNHAGAVAHLEERASDNSSYKGWFDYRGNERTDPLICEAIESLGQAANGSCAELKVIEIPDKIKYTIEEYDGVEWVAEVHRTWS